MTWRTVTRRLNQAGLLPSDQHLYDSAKALQVLYAPPEKDAARLDLTDERARLAKAQADRTELEVAELRGQVIREEDVVEHWAQMVSAARQRLLALPSVAAGQVASPDRLTAVETLLRGLIVEALEELSGNGKPERRRALRAEDGEDLDAAAELDSQPVGRLPPPAKSRGQRRARAVSD